MNKRTLRQIQAIAVVLVSLVYLGLRSLPTHNKAAAVQTEKSYGGFYYVDRVVDGDTLKLSDGSRVRLIGVDTPEVHYSDKLLRDARKSGRELSAIQTMGKKSSDFTRTLVAGRKVRLEFDVEKRDRHNRLLAYVYIDDGKFLNAAIISEGYGQVMTVPPNVKYSDLFLELEKEARRSRKGLWGEKAGF